MTTELWKLEKDLCRCCHAEGSFLNLAGIKGQEEQYSEMLRQSFNIDLSPVSGPLYALTYTICEDCALRLKDASSFKEQVLACEERFKELYERAVKGLDSKLGLDVKKETEDYDIKMEESAIDHNDIDDNDDIGDDGFETKFDDIVVDVHKPMLRILLEDCDVKVKRKTKPRVQPRAKRKNVKRSLRSQKAEDEADPDAEQDPEMDEGKDDAETATPAKKKSQAARKKPNFVLKEEDYRREGEEYFCALCDKKYDKIFSLRFHIKTKHYKIPRYNCAHCMKSFMTLAPLTVHKLQEHNIDDRFKCKACYAVFNTKIQLRKHINNFHMLGEKYKCEFCEYESFSFESMYKHKYKHKTVKDFHCRFCRKSFLRKATLDLHERIHTGDRRKVCKVCGQAFVQKASLNYHMTKYHPEVNF